jgi:AbiV family abortive infection protein
MNTKREKYFEGFVLAIDNAKSLFESAELLSENGRYSAAISLLVLSAEEGMKGIYFFTGSSFPEQAIFDEKMIENHKYKLESIRSTVGISTLMTTMMNLIYGEIFENPYRPVEEIKELKSKGVERTVAWLENEAKSTKTDFALEMEWWKHAKNLKEDSLYVRKSGNGWHTPLNTKKSSYEKTKNYVEEFITKLYPLKNIDFESDEFKDILNEFKNLSQNKGSSDSTTL